MQHLCLWRWYLPDVTGKLKPSRWRMTEAEAQARYPGCTKVADSLEVRQFEPDTGHSMASGLVRREDGRWRSRARQAGVEMGVDFHHSFASGLVMCHGAMVRAV